MTGDAPTTWTLQLGEHPPVPVVVREVDHWTTFYVTPARLPLGVPGRPGRRVTVRAVLTAPDGSQEVGAGSVDGMVWYADRSAATAVSFTPDVMLPRVWQDV
jgi:hypothetical protein